MKKKLYKITGYLYVPLDAEVLATSKKEAEQKYKDFCDKQTQGYDYEPRIHEVLVSDEPQATDIGKPDDYGDIEDVEFTNNRYVF